MEQKKTRLTGPPPKQGLYDPAFEHDACGVGFIVDIHGRKSHAIVKDALTILLNLDHRGAVGSEHNTGDGAGILTHMPDKFLRRVCAEQGIHLPELGKYATEVLSAYGITLMLMLALLVQTLRRGAKARAALRQAEQETARHGKN